MNNNKVKIIVYENSNKFLNYLVYHSIYYEDLTLNDNYILTIDYEDYKKISRRYKTKIIKYYGKRFIINYLDTNKYMLISLFISFLVLYLLTNTIFKININTNDEKLYNLINNSLKENNISIYKRKKSFKELKKIKDKILKNNEDSLEWIEIKEKGCIYNVELTARVKNKENNSDNNPKDIVASKDGLIKYITSSSGVKLKDVNDYVKKGEVLISGNIIKGEDTLITQVRAKGKVYAEVWYTVNITIPFNYVEYVETGKVINHYYLDIAGKKFTLIGKYDSNFTMNTKDLVLEKPYLFFKLYKETKREYKYKEFNINENEAYKEALKRSENKIKSKLNDNEYIISKKVLKKEVFRSKMNIEVFFKVYENIGVTSNIVEKDDLNGVSN
ncbi:MAG: sporulation protein YqfD [Mollicutes bacterium]|nr:sporulation protein YqfD [Mollicutes bacterium]